MPIMFPCSCGKTLQVKDDFAGRRVKCPVCNGVAVVPAAKPAFEVIEDAPPVAPARPRANPVAEPPPAPARKATQEDDIEFEVVEDEKPRKKAKPRKLRDEDDEDDERPRKKVKARRPDEELEDDDDRVRTRFLGVEEDDDQPRPRKKKKKDEKPDHLALEKSIINGGVGAGLAAMVIAVIWLVVGLVVLDVFFYYPPILFVIGVVALIKGLTSGNENK